MKFYGPKHTLARNPKPITWRDTFLSSFLIKEKTRGASLTFSPCSRGKCISRWRNMIMHIFRLYFLCKRTGGVIYHFWTRLVLFRVRFKECRDNVYENFMNVQTFSALVFTGRWLCALVMKREETKSSCLKFHSAMLKCISYEMYFPHTINFNAIFEFTGTLLVLRFICKGNF